MIITTNVFIPLIRFDDAHFLTSKVPVILLIQYKIMLRLYKDFIKTGIKIFMPETFP